MTRRLALPGSVPVALLLLAVLLPTWSCGDSGTEPKPPEPARAESLTVSASSPSGVPGETTTLTAQIKDQRGQVFSVTQPVSFDASGTGEITIQTTGDLTATATLMIPGEVTVTARYGTLSATTGLEIEPRVATSLVLEPSVVTLGEGDTLRVSVTAALDQRGDAIALPEGEITWSLSPDSVAEVSGGLIQGVRQGTFVVTAEIAGVQGTRSGTVTEVAARLSERTIYMDVGEERRPPPFVFRGDTVSAREIFYVSGESPAPVLDTEALNFTDPMDQRLLAREPGTARVMVGMEPIDGMDRVYDTLTVVVRQPDQALVLGLEGGRSAVGTGDRLVLRGHSLSLLTGDAIRFNGQALVMKSRTDTRIEFEAPATAAMNGCLPAPRGLLEVAGATVADTVSLEIVRKREGELSLAVGDTAHLAGAEHCLMLEAGEDRQYALVFFDTRVPVDARDGWVRERSSTAPLVHFPDYPPYSVKMTEQGVVTTVASGAGSPPPGLSSTHVHLANQASSDDPCSVLTEYEVDRVLAVGDTIQQFVASGAPCGTMVVRRVTDGYAAFVSLDGVEIPSPVLDSLEAAMQVVLAHQWIYEAAFGASGRVPTTKAGQLIVWIDQRGNHGGPSIFGEAHFGTAGQAGKIVVLWYGGTHLGTNSTFYTIAHEMAHLWAFRHIYGAGLSAPGLWSTEGVADLVTFQVMKQAQGRLPQDPHDAYAIYPEHFWQGYRHPQSFFRHLKNRLIREAGLPYTEALGLAAKGAAEGWYGYSYNGEKRLPGLHGRMSPHFPGWTPEEALITWLLAYVTNGTGAHPILNDPDHPGFAWPWVGSEIYVAGSGKSLSLANHPTLSGWALRIDDDRIGGAWTLSADVPLHWGIMRTR